MTIDWHVSVWENRSEYSDCILVGLIGCGIAASRTPKMHMVEGTALGLHYEYRLIDLADTEYEPDLPEVLTQVEAAGFNGLNVTYPFKQAVIPHLDELSPNAKSIGSVNTIVFREGRRYGHNTDYWGFKESFQRGLPDVKLDIVLLLGAGGAGGAVGNALLDLGVRQLLIYDTNETAAIALETSLKNRLDSNRVAIAEEVTVATDRADGLVNASPVGMEKLPGTPLPSELISARHWVVDIVYFPLETELLAAARAKGCKILPGSGMAVYQAVRAFELFTGKSASPERMQATFKAFDVEGAQ